MFVDDGYVKFPIALDEEFARGFDDDVSRIWEERPDDLAISLFDGPTAFSDYDGRVRNVGYRIPDLHSHSAHALDLYLHPKMFRMVELIYDQPAISFQSLYFEYGSQQALHRDPMYVVTDPPSHLLASWVALEDISPRERPARLRAEVAPTCRGSSSSPTRWCAARRSPRRSARPFEEWKRTTMRDRGARSRRRSRVAAATRSSGTRACSTAGSRIGDRSQTRKSFVVHYCTAANYASRGREHARARR